jgi:stage II sporulation protein D
LLKQALVKEMLLLRKFMGSLVLVSLLTGWFCQISLALPDKVLVSLFGTQKLLKQVVIDGPLELMQPMSKRLPVRSIRIVVNGNRVRAESVADSADRGTAIVSANRLMVCGINGLTVIHPDPGHSRSYKGVIFLSAGQGKLVVENLVSARDYVKAVVGSETLPEFPAEELKAQSVLAQTLLARYKLGDSLNDTTETEAYLGQECVRPAVAEAVDDTWGQRLEFHGRPVRVYFHSTCAGGTSDGEVYFSLKKGSAPYLKGAVCNYCKHSPFWQAKIASLPLSQWSKTMGNAGPVVVALTDNRGRPLQINSDRQTLSGYEFWLKVGQELGWDKMPGTRYQIISQPDKVILTSTGAGHGVGLCQWGASELARMGKSYAEILSYYFPGTAIQKLNHVAPSPSPDQR